jgi:Ubiquitin family
MTNFKNNLLTHSHIGIGRSFVVKATKETLVLDLKAIIQKQSSVDPNNQLLIYKSQVMQDNRTLEYYHVFAKDTIHCRKHSPKSPMPRDLSSHMPGSKGMLKSPLGRGIGHSSSSKQSTILNPFEKQSRSTSEEDKYVNPKSSSTRGPWDDAQEDFSGFETEDSDEEDSQLSRDKGAEILTNLLSKEETAQRMVYWRSRAKEGNFNANTHIVDPVAHYSHLHHLEEYVVTHSEYFWCRGKYLVEDDAGGDWANDSALFEQIPSPILGMLPRNHLATKITPPVQLPELHGLLESLCKSYLVLCRVVASFEYLQEMGFCGTFYSVLVERRETATDVAEMLQIKRDELEILKINFESAMSHIHQESLCVSSAASVIWDQLGGQCDYILGLMGLQCKRPPPNIWMQIMYSSRMAVLLLDLGLVTYVGSHGSRFDSYVRSDAESIYIRSKVIGSCVKCSLRPLACLNEFLNTPVWVFQLEGETPYPQGRGTPGKELSILTRIDVFADVWGPVWPVRENPSDPTSMVLQYNVSRGFIRRAETLRSPIKNAIMCHLYPRSFSDADRGSSLPAGQTGLVPVRQDDRLLIGGLLREDPHCPYKSRHYEDDYDDSMGYLGTVPEFWRLEQRTLGFTAGQYIGLVANGTQKLIPGVTLKEHIWNEFSQSPQNANIDWLNNFVGVEISHCTGNARRIRMRDLLRVKKVRERLNRLVPNWERTEWGQQFSRALNDSDFAAIQRLWDGPLETRQEIGTLVSKMLQLLHTTGLQGQRDFVAAYFGNGVDKFSTLPTRGNEWAKSLRDSMNTATYAVIGDMCLKYTGRNNSAELCSQQHTTTVFQTKITSRAGLSPGQYIRLKPIGRIFLVDDIDVRRQIMLVPAIRVPRPNITTATEVLDPLTLTARPRFLVVIKAATESYGGMGERRQLVERPPQRPQGRKVKRRQKVTVAPGSSCCFQ